MHTHTHTNVTWSPPPPPSISKASSYTRQRHKAFCLTTRACGQASDANPQWPTILTVWLLLLVSRLQILDLANTGDGGLEDSGLDACTGLTAAMAATNKGTGCPVLKPGLPAEAPSVSEHRMYLVQEETQSRLYLQYINRSTDLMITRRANAPEGHSHSHAKNYKNCVSYRSQKCTSHTKHTVLDPFNVCSKWNRI